MFEEIKNIQTNNKDIKSFGITIGIILFILSGVLMYYENQMYQLIAIIASSFVGIGLILPILLMPIYLVWMTFAVILGWIMTRLILSILFFFIISPIGLIKRVTGLNPANIKEKDDNSYWNHRNSKAEQSQDYQKQF